MPTAESHRGGEETMVQLHAAHILYVSYVLLHMCLYVNFAKFCPCPPVKTVCACRRTSAALHWTGFVFRVSGNFSLRVYTHFGVYSYHYLPSVPFRRQPFATNLPSMAAPAALPARTLFQVLASSADPDIEERW